jgi:glycosyltransferase involved in cell wall biosynthesis
MLWVGNRSLVIPPNSSGLEAKVVVGRGERGSTEALNSLHPLASATNPPGTLDCLRLMERVRIIVVIGVLDLGGSERQAVWLASYLRHTAGADVEMWGCSASGGRVAELCREHDIPCRLLPLPWMPEWSRARQLKALWHFTSALRRARADVILPYITLTNVCCGWVWRLTSAKTCIWNQRESGISEPLGERLKHWAVRLTPWFTANSQHGADYLIQKHSVRRSRVAVIHNAVELPLPEASRAAWRKMLNVTEDSFLAVMVANLHMMKDHATLIKAWRFVNDELASILILAGRFDGTEDSLKSLAANLGLSDRVRFLGPVKDISGLLHACDLGVFSSPAEGCPNAVLECMSAALPVVASDIPGVREAVGAEGIRFLAPFGNAREMANRILELARDGELRSRIGRVNRERVEMEFSPSVVGEKARAFISTVLARGNG